MPISTPGLYGFGNGQNFVVNTANPAVTVDTAIYTLDFVQGMTCLFQWSDLEPTEGVYYWEALDRHITLASAQGKKINVQLYAGSSSPQWLLDSLSGDSSNTPGQQKLFWGFTNPQDGQSFTEVSPLPWNATYLQKWDNFINAFATRYDGNSTINYVSLTGGTTKDLSTGTVIQDQADWDDFVALGWNLTIHEGAWNDCVDIYRNRFSTTQLAIGLGVLRSGDPITTLPQNVMDRVILNNWEEIGCFTVTLSDGFYLTGQPSRNLVTIMQNAQTNGHSAGAQMIDSFYRERDEVPGTKRINSPKTAVNLGITDNADFMEVWHDDLIYPRGLPDIGNTVNVKYKSLLSCANNNLTA